MTKPLDICTGCIPRCTSKRAMKSFVAALLDRDEYELWWYCHLDHYPPTEQHYVETLRQLDSVTHLFDHATILTPERPAYYGGMVKTLLEATRHDVLWIDDDWVWDKPFRIGDIQRCIADNKADFFSFLPREKPAVGNTHPTYWTRPVIDYLLAHYPTHLQQTYENQTVRALKPAGFTLCSLVDLDSICRDIGREALQSYGQTHNAFGQRLGERLRRPRWDKRKKEWIKL